MSGKPFFTKDDFNGDFGNVTEGPRAVALNRLEDGIHSSTNIGYF